MHDRASNGARDAGLEVLRLLADETRWRMLNELRHSDRQVSELIELLALPQNLISYHLRALRSAGLVRAHRSDADGRATYYALDLAALRAGLETIGGQLALGPVTIGAIPPLSVAFICTHNSARSQMAEGWLRHLSGGRVIARSAGAEPSQIHPLAIRAMAEVGLDIGYQQAKPIDALAGTRLDLAITVCDVAREDCRPWLGGQACLHWSIPDPVRAAGEEGQAIAAFRAVRDDLRARVEALLADLPNLGRAQ